LTFYTGNDHPDDLTGLWNLTEDVGEIMRFPYISCLKNRCCGMHIFIITKVPFFERNIRKLKRIEDRGFILFVESANVKIGEQLLPLQGT
jgi:hypothetical protein